MSGSTPPPAGDSSPEPDADPPGVPSVKLREIAATALISGGVTALFAALTDSVRALGPGLVLLVCALIGLALAALLTMGGFARRLRRWLEPVGAAVVRRRTGGRSVPGGGERPPRRRHRRLERFAARLSTGYLGVLLGAAVVTVPWGVVQGGTWLSHRIWPPDCDRPLELRVVTAPENMTVLRESIARFTREKLVNGCAPYAISVGVAPSIDELTYAFGDNWYRDDARQEGDEPFRRLYGPRADAWVATSTGEAELVANDVGPGGAALDIGPSVASDRLVIGMISGRAEKVRKELPPGPPNSHSLRVLWEVIRSKFAMPVNYPQPELSTAGLVVVFDLLPLSSAVGWEQRDLVAESVSSLLCRVRIASRENDDEELDQSPALVVPLHSLREYNDGRFNDPHCPEGAPSGKTKLQAFLSPGLSRLDYPFVTIGWPNERNAERDAALRLLRGWLVAHPLFNAGPGQETAMRDPRELRIARGRFLALLPRVDAEIALDVSGSMAEPPRSLLTQLRETFPGIKPLITPRDDFTLSSFSTVRGESLVRRLHPAVGRAQFDSLTRMVAGTKAEGSDAPISDMIMNLNGRSGAPGRALVVVTDGGVFNDEPTGASIGATLARAPNVSALYVLALGDNGCDRSPPREGKYRECVEAGPDMQQALRHVISSLRGKDRP
ncbi:vWA domain-containing protein [Streptosporangium amethystogenes]|uniref:vWA domain-containing protein n=1 Tax=Streptosporangium amethystogenes TaxID=2002 RepID=UPI0012F72152|nr:vWA domain-containing protein [Streptosporangium amethystogenes]